MLAKQVLSAQPEKRLLINDRYYGVPERLVGLPAERERHFSGRVKKHLTRRLLEVYPDGSALVEIGSGIYGETTERLRRDYGVVPVDIAELRRVKAGKGGGSPEAHEL